MKVEEKKLKEGITLFRDIKVGKCFTDSSGYYYLKMEDSTYNNCVNLFSGKAGLCFGRLEVKILKNAKFVPGD